MSALQEASLIGEALDACGRKLDGSAAAPEYYRRRRRTFYGALKYAVREKHLSANPLDGAFTEAQAASPLARKPYDFRHAGVSWRLNAGTPATLVAEWAGHTVEVCTASTRTASTATTNAGSPEWSKLLASHGARTRCRGCSIYEGDLG